jgi:hypothetical protein
MRKKQVILIILMLFTGLLTTIGRESGKICIVQSEKESGSEVTEEERFPVLIAFSNLFYQ